jgi:hypothetical protein
MYEFIPKPEQIPEELSSNGVVADVSQLGVRDPA